MIERVLDRALRLEFAPEFCRQVPEFRVEHRRKVLERPYLIINRQLGDRIELLLVMHDRRLTPEQADDLDLTFSRARLHSDARSRYPLTSPAR